MQNFPDVWPQAWTFTVWNTGVYATVTQNIDSYNDTETFLSDEILSGMHT